MRLRLKLYFYKFMYIFLAICLIGMLVYIGFNLLFGLSKGTFKPIDIIALFTALFSLPGFVKLVEEAFKPKKKVYKLSSKCPKCKHLIEMDMIEE